jgi:hypothetical protein
MEIAATTTTATAEARNRGFNVWYKGIFSPTAVSRRSPHESNEQSPTSTDSAAAGHAKRNEDPVHDVIEARAQSPEGIPADSQSILDGLRGLGCSYEGANPGFIGVDVPPTVDLMTVRQFLIASDQEWEHADPPHEDLFPAVKTTT